MYPKQGFVYEREVAFFKILKFLELIIPYLFTKNELYIPLVLATVKYYWF